jgi:hypothetical protein
MKGKPRISIKRFHTENARHVGGDKRAENEDHQRPMEDPGLEVPYLDLFHRIASVILGAMS